MRQAEERSDDEAAKPPSNPVGRAIFLGSMLETWVTHLHGTGSLLAQGGRSPPQSSQARLLKGVAVDLIKHGAQYFLVDQAQAGHKVRDKRLTLGSCGLKC